MEVFANIAMADFLSAGLGCRHSPRERGLKAIVDGACIAVKRNARENWYNIQSDKKVKYEDWPGIKGTVLLQLKRRHDEHEQKLLEPLQKNTVEF